MAGGGDSTRRQVLATGMTLGAFSLAGLEAFGPAHAQRVGGRAGGALGFTLPLDDVALHKRWAAEGVRDDPDGDKRLGLAVRCRTDPERIRPFLAPPLEPDPLGEVQINFFIILNKVGRSTVFVVGPLYGECDMYVGCVYCGHRCMTALPWVLDQDYGRYAGRESVMLRKKDGLVYLDVVDGTLHAACIRRGKTAEWWSAEGPEHDGVNSAIAREDNAITRKVMAFLDMVARPTP